MQFPESAVPMFSTQFGTAIYNEQGTIVQTSVQLAPLTGVFLNPSYACGQLLAQYNLNAPSPSLVGQFVNYSAASANADQSVAVAIITEQWVQPTAGGNGGFYRIAFLQAPLVISGTQLSFSNEPADIAAFITAYNPFKPPVGSCLGFEYNGQPDQVYILK